MIQSEEQRRKNERLYVASWGILKQVYADGTVDTEILQRLNRRNAEVLECREIPLL